MVDLRSIIELDLLISPGLRAIAFFFLFLRDIGNSTMLFPTAAPMPRMEARILPIHDGSISNPTLRQP